MEPCEYLRALGKAPHFAVAAAVDEDGLPISAAVQILDWDEQGIHFLCSKDSGLYDRLLRQAYMSLTAANSADSPCISLRGKVRRLDTPPQNTFLLYEGTGQWIDHSVFTFGAGSNSAAFYITDACLGCGICAVYCPQNCVDFPGGLAKIRQADCLHCGKCMEVCPASAVIRQ